MEISGVLERQEGNESPCIETLVVPRPNPSGWPAGVEPDEPPRPLPNVPLPAVSGGAAPQGGRWVNGQSGNPAGRPPKRAHVAAYVANGLINRKTMLLTQKAIEKGLLGDKTLLRHCLAHIAPPR